jgi:hypothetical protein
MQGKMIFFVQTIPFVDCLGLGLSDGKRLIGSEMFAI